MTDDLATRLRASHEAQETIQDMLDDAPALLKALNDLFNAPADRDAYLAALRYVTRLSRRMADLDRTVRYEWS